MHPLYDILNLDARKIFIEHAEMLAHTLGDIAAASAVVAVPLIVLVLFFQQHIIEGLTQGGIKE